MSTHSGKHGYSLVEVVLAASICASALVPALALLRDSVSLGEMINKRHLLTIYGVSKMEEQMAVVAATWPTTPETGDFAADGNPDIRFTVARSDSPASGGITGRLMNITITIYSDDDSDDLLDASEMRTVLTTKIANLVSYVNKASS